jgi:hypothetical protein
MTLHPRLVLALLHRRLMSSGRAFYRLYQFSRHHGARHRSRHHDSRWHICARRDSCILCLPARSDCKSFSTVGHLRKVSHGIVSDDQIHLESAKPPSPRPPRESKWTSRLITAAVLLGFACVVGSLIFGLTWFASRTVKDWVYMGMSIGNTSLAIEYVSPAYVCGNEMLNIPVLQERDPQECESITGREKVHG